MKATELRLGNYIQGSIIVSNGEVIENNHILVDLNVLKMSIDEQQSAISRINPIPLTEDWILKFGLKRKDEEYFYLKEYDHQILIDINTFDVVLDFREEGYYVTIKHDLKYVHKLQNFYFELNDRELELRQ